MDCRRFGPSFRLRLRLVRFARFVVWANLLLLALACFAPASFAQQGGTWTTEWFLNGNPSTSSVECEATADVFIGVGNPLPGTPDIDRHPAPVHNAVSGTLTLRLTWNPKNNNLALDPPPSQVVLYYRAVATVTANAGVEASTRDPDHGTSANAQGNVTCTIDDVTLSHSATANAVTTATQWAVRDDDPGPAQKTKAAPRFKTVLMQVSGGVAQRNFNVSLVCHGQVGIDNDAPPLDFKSYARASLSASGRISAFVAGKDMSRNNGAYGTGIDGNGKAASSDPTFTRWLPLAFSPSISSQPFRNELAHLPVPWGNINCMYSPGIHVEYSPDENGTGNWYRPPGFDSENGGNGAGQITDNTRGFKASYVLIDANGDRIPLGPNLQPTTSINSNFSGSTLTNAGPPGHMRERGHYTYTFETAPTLPPDPPADEPLPPYPPIPPAAARLLSIADDLGNRQTLTYNPDGQGGSGSSSPPYLTVSDLTSGRQMRFYRFNGFIVEVVAPSLTPNVPAITTTLLPDGQGRYTAVAVHNGGGGGPVVRQDTYAYNGDSATVIWQGGVKQTNTYVDSPSKDLFGAPIRRLASSTMGNSSSDNGTVSYSYGTITEGYGHYGVDSRTNYFTDALNNRTQTIYHYANPESGSENGAISAIDTTGPTFTGASNPNVSRQLWTPDITKPTSSTVVDALQHPWTTNYDGLGMPTQTTDPLGHITLMGWSGTDLTTLEDPTHLIWQFAYGPGGRMTGMTDPAGVVRMQATYNAYGQPATVTVPASVSASGQLETTRYTYDDANAGDLLSVTEPSGAVSVVGLFGLVKRGAGKQILSGTSYDALGDPLNFTIAPDTGNPLTSVTPLVTSLTWNAQQLVTGATLPNGLRLNHQYDAGGRKTATVTRVPGGPVLSSNAFVYDTRGRLKQASDAVGVTSVLTYDANSNLTGAEDANHNLTTLTYGPNNELISSSSPGAGNASFQYDAAGRVRQSTDANGRQATYVYDAADRLLSLSIAGFPDETLTYAYDDGDRPLSVVKANGDKVEYFYAPISMNKRLTQVKTSTAGTNTWPSGRVHSVLYDYYPDGKRRTMTSVVGTQSLVTSYEWDKAGRLATLVSPSGSRMTWTYDAIGRVLYQLANVNSNFYGTAYTYGSSGVAGDSSTAPTYLRSIEYLQDGSTSSQYTLTRWGNCSASPI